MMLFYALLPSLVALVSAQCWSYHPVTCNGPTEAAFPGTWDSNNYAPANRSVAPASLLTWPNLAKKSWPRSYALKGNGSIVTLDFGKEVGGIVSVSYTASGQGQLGLAFTEAKNYVGEWSDSSNGKFVGPDGAIYGNFTTGSATYLMPQEKLRGGFRYMTLFLITNSSTATLTPTDISVELDFQPTWPNLRAYQGYFHSNDALLNRLFYAGAYTLQSNAVPTNTGRQVPMLSYGWANNATLGPGDTIIVDGAKRDRAVWPGDMGIAVPSAFVSTGDLDSVKNALQIMYNTQNNKTGAFAESGPPLSQTGSDTYHAWTMIGTYNYFLYTNDTTFLSSNWAKYLSAMNFIYGKVDSSGLMNVTGIRDWARVTQGNHNTEANIILVHTLNTGALLATWQGYSALAANWTAQAATLTAHINAQCWYPTAGAYKDNDTSTTLVPQDANSLSLYLGVAPANRTASIAQELTNNWTPIGPQTPELPYNISPFITSFELLGRLAIRDTARALELMRTTWGWIINNKNSTESTFLEGYLTNGSFSYRNYRGYAYDETYPSHAHGWSSGPTSALTNRVLGLDVTAPAGSNWTLSPQPGDLTHVEGGFTTPLGKFSAKWVATTNKAGKTTVKLTWTVPAGTLGVVTLPINGSGVVGGNADFSLWAVDASAPVGGKVQTVAGRPSGLAVRSTVFGEQLASFGVGGGSGSVSFPM